MHAVETKPYVFQDPPSVLTEQSSCFGMWIIQQKLLIELLLKHFLLGQGSLWLQSTLANWQLSKPKSQYTYVYIFHYISMHLIYLSSSIDKCMVSMRIIKKLDLHLLNLSFKRYKCSLSVLFFLKLF